MSEVLYAGLSFQSDSVFVLHMLVFPCFSNFYGFHQWNHVFCVLDKWKCWILVSWSLVFSLSFIVISQIHITLCSLRFVHVAKCNQQAYIITNSCIQRPSQSTAYNETRKCAHKLCFCFVCLFFPLYFSFLSFQPARICTPFNNWVSH